MSDESKPRQKPIYIGAPQAFELEMSIRSVCEAFHAYEPPHYSGCYYVGSVIERPDWRDVDIRLILSDEDFRKLFPKAGTHHEMDARWLLMTTAISQWLSKQTGLPIDFQFQSQSHANEHHKGVRSAIGLRITESVQSEIDKEQSQ